MFRRSSRCRAVSLYGLRLFPKVGEPRHLYFLSYPRHVVCSYFWLWNQLLNREQHSVSVGLMLNVSEASKGRNNRENTSVWCQPDEFAVGGADWAETHSVDGIFSFLKKSKMVNIRDAFIWLFFACTGFHCSLRCDLRLFPLFLQKCNFQR